MQKNPAKKKSVASFITAEMRRRAGAQLRKRQRKQGRKAGRRKSSADTQELLHDLRVHEIELEMQNEELQATRNRMEALLQKYTELYDFAPIGYFSLDEEGRILEVNLTGAALLGVERTRLVNRSLARFVAPAGRPIFLSFLEQMFSGPRSRLCEARLLKADGTAIWASLHGTSDRSGRGARKWCRVAVLDITTRKQAEQVLQAAQDELERRVKERTAELKRNCVRLAHEIEERKRAEQDVAKELNFETLLAEISSRFVNLPASELDREIVDAQRRIFKLLGLDVSGFWRWSAEASGFFRITGFSRGGEGPQLPARMNAQEYLPWLQQQVLAGRTVAVRSLKELPPEAVRDRKTFRQFGFKSNLTIPLSAGGEPPIGALGFTTRAEREWPDALVKRLQLVAQIFANALARRRANQAMRESEARLSSIYNTVGDAIFRLEVEAEGQYRFVSINQAFCRVTGLSLEQVVGKSVTEVISEPSLTMVLAKYRQAIETQTIVRWEEVSDYPAGRLTGEVSATPIFDDKGKCTHLVGSVHDITERMRAEEGLKESEEMLRSIFASTPDSITVVDLDGRIKHCNQSTAHIHGFSSAEQLLGKNVAELVAEEDRQRMPEVTQQVMTHGIAKDVPFVGLKGSGGKFAGELSFSVLKDASGRPIGFVGITRDVTKRKRTEDALRANELKYRNLVEMTGTGYLIIDVQGRVLDANQEYVRISGHRELREIIGRSVIEWTAERAKQRNAEAVAQCAKNGLIRNFVTEYADASGRSTFVEVNATVEGEGESARIVSLCRDITERKRTEEALQESEARFSAVANTAPVLIWMSGTDKLCNFFNKSWLDFTGRPLEAELGNGWTEGVHADDLAKCLKTYVESFEARRPFTMEYRLRRHDGEYRWVSDHGVPRYDPAQNFLGYIGSCLDLTERKRAEQALKESVERFRQVAAISGEFIWEVDAQGLYTYANPLVERILGYTAEELVGKKHFYDLFDPSVRAELKAAAFQMFADRRAFRDFPHPNVSKSGKIVHLETSGVPILDADGNLTGYRGTDTDVTERKQTEAELLRERAELAHVARVSTMGELAASLAHELNQPLGAILANSEAAELFLQQNPPMLDELRAILADIRKDDERAGEVIHRMRALLRKHELEREPIEINSLVEDVLQLVSGDASLRGVSLSADLRSVLPQISGDRVHLQQVLLNLILNGMDAMTGEPRERRRITVRTRFGAEGMVELAVVDSGHGIEADKLPRLFEPFYTTKPHGMGMGLSIAHTIIAAHRGRIWAENNPSGGAVFRIVLPAL